MANWLLVMRTLTFICLAGCMSLLVSCGRAPSGHSEYKSVEQRVADLDRSFDDGSPRPSADDLKKEAEHDLAEIRSMGLVDRALREFGSRFPGATVESCRISYFVDTNTVRCSIGYRVAGKDDLQDDSFGYRRQSGTNWVLTK